MCKCFADMCKFYYPPAQCRICMVEYQTPDAVAEKRQLADAVDRLKEQLQNADSIANGCPLFSEFFHRVRTSSYDGRNWRYVALYDYDPEADKWTHRSTHRLQKGTHLKDTGADLCLSMSPKPFLSVSSFSEIVRGKLSRDARASRQNASNIDRRAKEQAHRKEHGY